MGWYIYLEKNTVRINLSIATELHSCGAEVCFAWEDECTPPVLGGVIIHDGKLVFNSDHMEHMDYVCDARVQAVLKRHKVKGDICFSSNEGDNKGQRWGYRFDGKGGMVELKGKKGTWEEKPTKKKSSVKKAKKKAKPDPFAGVKDVIEAEGFDYAFRSYSDFNEIKDERFQQLRAAYVFAAQELEKHINRVS